MPPVPVPANQFFLSHIAGLHNRLSALESQQQSTVTDGEGRPVMNTGLAPASNPPQYGLQLMDPETAGQMAMLGVQEDGTTCLRFFDANGTVRTQIDKVGIHLYNESGVEVSRLDDTGVSVFNGSGGLQTLIDQLGLHSYNGSGTEEVTVGKQPSGQYGLAVLPGGDTAMQMIGGVKFVEAPSFANATGTSPYKLPGSSVTVQVGSSGKAFVTASCQIATNGGGQQGILEVYVDGSYNGAYLVASAGDSGGVNGSYANSWVSTGLSPGSHTFDMRIYVSSGASVNFYYPTMVIQPL